MRFNPPPTWPVPPEGWLPWEGWTPDPAWGPAPQGWAWLIPDDSAQGSLHEPEPVPPAEESVPEPAPALAPAPVREIRLTPLPLSAVPAPERGNRRTVLNIVGALLLLFVGVAVGYAARGQKTVRLAAQQPAVRIVVSPTPTPVPTTVYVGSTADPSAASGLAAPAPPGPLTDQGITLQSISLRSDGGKEAASVRLTNDGGHAFDVGYTVTVLGDHGQLLATLTGTSRNLRGGKTLTGQLTSPDSVVTQLSSIAFQVDTKTKK